VSLSEIGSAARSKIIREVVGDVAPVNGVIFAHERVKRAAGSKIDPHYACLLDAIDYWHRYSPAAHLRVRKCLEDLVAADPSFALGYAYLAKVYTREHYFDADPPGEATAMDRALQAAQRAVELNPGSARACQALMAVHAIRREIEPALAAGRMAMRLNPYSNFVKADLGFHLVAFGRVDEGLRMLREASTGWMARPVWLDMALALGFYLVDDLPAARTYADAVTSETSPWALLVRAVIAVRSGEPEQARQLANQLVAIQPSWRNDPRGRLQKKLVAPEIVDRVARDFAAIDLTKRD
jgi:adenylate cyclase